MPNSDLIQSVVRAADLLMILAGAENGLRLAEVAALLEVKKPTAHNLLRSLAAREFATRSGDGTRYVLGSAALELSEKRKLLSMERSVQTVARTLFSNFPDSVITYSHPTPAGGELRVRYRIAPERPNVLQEPMNQVFSSYGSLSLLCYLALSPSAIREQFKRRYPLEEYGRHIFANEEMFQHALEDIRAQGYAVPEHNSRTRVGIAVPVTGAGFELIGILGVSAPLPENGDAAHVQLKMIEKVNQIVREMVKDLK